MVEGEGTVEIEGRAAIIGPGSAIFKPGNAKHRTSNTGSAPLRFVFVFPTETFEEIQYHLRRVTSQTFVWQYGIANGCLALVCNTRCADVRPAGLPR